MTGAQEAVQARRGEDVVAHASAEELFAHFGLSAEAAADAARGLLS